MSRLHTVSVRVDGIETYNALFSVLVDDFRWPLLYGKQLTPDLTTRRNYASFRVGNVNLELCGPYPKEFVAGNPPARFHGLTFWPASNATASLCALDVLLGKVKGLRMILTE